MGKKEMPINWIGSSYEDLLAFPDDAKQNAGYQLGRLQVGLEPTDCKHLTGLGKGMAASVNSGFGQRMAAIGSPMF